MGLFNRCDIKKFISKCETAQKEFKDWSAEKRMDFTIDFENEFRKVKSTETEALNHLKALARMAQEVNNKINGEEIIDKIKYLEEDEANESKIASNLQEAITGLMNIEKGLRIIVRRAKDFIALEEVVE